MTTKADELALLPWLVLSETQLYGHMQFFVQTIVCQLKLIRNYPLWAGSCACLLVCSMQNQIMPKQLADVVLWTDRNS